MQPRKRLRRAELVGQLVEGVIRPAQRALVTGRSLDGLAYAIRQALDMPLAERKARYDKLIQTVRDDNVAVWMQNFITDLQAAG